VNIRNSCWSWLPLFLGALFLLVFSIPEAQAGPGGEVIELVFKTKIGRILFGIAAVILLPLFLYIFIREKIGIKRTKQDLEALAKKNPIYDWEALEGRVTEGVRALYRSWSKGDLSPAARFIDPDYLQSQQDILDRWKDEGKKNVCRMNQLKGVAPLYVAAGNAYSNPVVAVRITLDLVDFMLDTTTNDVIKGKDQAHEGKDVIWIMIHDGQDWMLDSIENGDESLIYAKLENQTMVPQFSAINFEDEESNLSSTDLSPEIPAQEMESSRVHKPQSEHPNRQPKQN